MYDINAYMFTHFFVWILLDQIATVLPYDSEPPTTATTT